MEENRKFESMENIDVQGQQEEESSFSLRNILTMVILNWQWFVLSLFIFLCGALIYLRYKDGVYQMSVKMLIKDDMNNQRRNVGGQMLANMQDLGIMTNSAGIDNEVEILQSSLLAVEAVKDLKLYTEYYSKGRVKSRLLYRTQPVSVDLDEEHLALMDEEPFVFMLQLSYKNGQYDVNGKVLAQEKPKNQEELFY